MVRGDPDFNEMEESDSGSDEEPAPRVRPIQRNAAPRSAKGFKSVVNQHSRHFTENSRNYEAFADIQQHPTGLLLAEV